MVGTAVDLSGLRHVPRLSIGGTPSAWPPAVGY